VSVDGSPTLLRHALEADPAGRYVLGDASALPVGDGSVDLVVAYNSLMDFDDMPRAMVEVARVLEPGAVFCICVTHPILDAGGFEGDTSDAPYVLRGRYFGTRRFEQTIVKHGLSMGFRGWSHSLEHYFSALFSAGFVIDGVREPSPATGADDYERWSRYPMFLHVRAIKR
jgi:SAM-dependent methyltransferase